MAIKPLKIEITVTAKRLKELADDQAQRFFEEFEISTMKKLGFKSKSILTNVIAEDPKFIEAIEKGVRLIIDDNDDYLVDIVYDADIPMLDKLQSDAEKLNEEKYRLQEERESIQREADQIKRSLKVLEMAGFKVTPPKMVDSK